MLEGKTCLITGAAKGIGRAIAAAFAAKKCNIALCYHKTEPAETVKICEDLGVQVLAVQGDVSSFDFAADFVKQTKERFGSIDIVVNDAGITRDMLLMRMKEKEFDDVINTNLKGTFNIIRHTAGILARQREGTIINLASVVGECGNAGQANYAASKAGVIGLTKSTAKELASRGITCNAIAPGYIETDMTAVLPEKTKESIINSIPLKRGGKPEDVASAAVFLAENRYINGQVLNVDGGMVM